MNELFELTWTKDFRRAGNTGKSCANSRKQKAKQHRRGKSGGQVRDEYREEFDPGRGGYGRAIADYEERGMRY